MGRTRFRLLTGSLGVLAAALLGVAVHVPSGGVGVNDRKPTGEWDFGGWDRLLVPARGPCCTGFYLGRVDGVAWAIRADHAGPGTTPKLYESGDVYAQAASIPCVHPASGAAGLKGGVDCRLIQLSARPGGPEPPDLPLFPILDRAPIPGESALVVGNGKKAVERGEYRQHEIDASTYIPRRRIIGRHCAEPGMRYTSWPLDKTLIPAPCCTGRAVGTAACAAEIPGVPFVGMAVTAARGVMFWGTALVDYSVFDHQLRWKSGIENPYPRGRPWPPGLVRWQPPPWEPAAKNPYPSSQGHGDSSAMVFVKADGVWKLAATASSPGAGPSFYYLREQLLGIIRGEGGP